MSDALLCALSIFAGIFVAGSVFLMGYRDILSGERDRGRAQGMREAEGIALKYAEPEPLQGKFEALNVSVAKSNTALTIYEEIRSARLHE